MSNTDEGFIDIRIALTRDEDGLVCPRNIERTGFELPDGTSAADIHRIVQFFLYEADTIAEHVAYAINGVVDDNV